MESYHKSVLLPQVISALDIKKNSWYLDCTLGDGGYSLEILKPGGNIVGIDVDPDAIARADKRLKGLGNYKLIQGNFRDTLSLLEKKSLNKKFDGIIFDLGVSIRQLTDPERGFSFMKEGPLDMRMDPRLSVRALDLIRIGGRKDLYELFKNFGEEKYSWAISNALVRARELGEDFQTTADLARLIEKTVGRGKKGINPSTRVFQALRIAVNDELGALQDGLYRVKDIVKKGGKIIVISFHSLEERIVKNTFKTWESSGFGEVLTKKPITPSDLEIAKNPRSRSAKMRIFKKI